MPAFRVVPAWLPLWLLLPGLAASGHAQAPAATDTASISGTVVSLASGEPIQAAEVSLYGRVLAGRTVSTMADAQGRFVFTGLAPGRYTVGASTPGFAPVLHGQRRVGAPGRPLLLAAGDRRDIRLQLPRLGSISGTVLDQLGVPLPRSSVQVQRFSMAAGYRRTADAGRATPDPDGRYRIEGLRPGEYAVCATSRQTGPLDAAQRLRQEIDRLRRNATYTLGPAGVAAQEQIAPKLAELEARLPAHVEPVFGYAPSCQPSASKGSMVTVGPEEARTAVNFTLVRTRLARIEGRVHAARPVTPQFGPVLLINVDERQQGGYVESARPDLDGRFVLPDVAPGRYAMFLDYETEARPRVRRIAGMAEVTVADQDLSEVILEVRPNATVAGQVVFDGASPPAADVLARLDVRLDPAVQGPIARHVGPFIAKVDASGRFVLRDVLPGDYRLRGSLSYTPDNPPGRWFAKEATVAGRDAMHRTLAIASGQSVADAVITMSDRPRATISGTILTEQGEPASDYWILVYPSDERERPVHARGMRGIRAGEDGAFAIEGLPAGSYRVATFLDGEFGDWYDPEFLKRVEGRSMPLAIAEAEQKTLHLRVPGPG